MALFNRASSKGSGAIICYCHHQLFHRAANTGPGVISGATIGDGTETSHPYVTVTPVSGSVVKTSDTDRSSKDGRTDVKSDIADRVKLGDRVVVTGLTEESRMNGQELVIHAIRNDGILVSSFEGRPVGVRPENVKLVNSKSGSPAGALQPQDEVVSRSKKEAEPVSSDLQAQQHAVSKPSMNMLSNPVPSSYPIIMAEQPDGSGHECLASDPNSEKYMIGVVSAPLHFKARQAIRESYAKEASASGIPVLFFVGELAASMPNKAKVEMELAGETDVVRLHGFEEGYHALSQKALGIFKHGYNACFMGVMKVDDDVFVNVQGLKKFLTGPDSLSLMSTYAGNVQHDSPVEKSPSGKWYAYDQYPHERWPDYMDGPGFFIGRKLIQHVMSNPSCLTDIRIDDAAVGVCLQNADGVRKMPMQHSGNNYQLDNEALVTYPLAASDITQLGAIVGQGGDVSGLTPSTCLPSAETACLCFGSPYFTSDEHASCWSRVSAESYVDVVPRVN